MRLLVPIFSLASGLLASSIPGSDKCTWGPTYWCTSITESHGCAATEFCLKKSWNQELSATNQNQLCDLCVSVMDKAIQQFKDNEPQLKETIENMCNYITMVDNCKEMVDENWEQIIQLINDDLDSQVLCSALNMCQQEHELVNEYQYVLATGFTGPLIMPNLPEVKNENDIQDDTEHHIKFEPETQVDEQAGLKCKDPHCVKCDDRTGYHCYICEDGYVFNYSVYHCVKVKDQENSATKTSATSASKQCNDCVQFGVDIREIAESSKKLEELVETIQEICDELEMRSLCRLVLNKKVIKKIIDKVNIIDICHQVDICTIYDHPVLPSSKGNTCTDCHSMIEDMRGLAENQFDKFENVIAHACDLAPKPINEMCRKMSKKFAEEAAESLKNADIDQCCQDISLCDKDGNDPYAIKFEKDSKSQQAISYPDYYFKQSKYCDYCEMTVEYIQYAIDSDMTQEQIKEGVKNICNQLGENHLIQTCKEFIDKYWAKIIDDMDMILDDPEQVCINMHLCKAKSNVEEILGGSIAYPAECTMGPVYWCKSEENRIKCGIPEDYCKKNVGLIKAIENLNENVPIDCTKGPSYWCASEENMKKCEVPKDYCKKHAARDSRL